MSMTTGEKIHFEDRLRAVQEKVYFLERIFNLEESLYQLASRLPENASKILGEEIQFIKSNILDRA